MNSPVYEETRKKALEALRNKDYESSFLLHLQQLEWLRREPVDVENLQERQRVLNNLLVSLHGRIQRGQAENPRESCRLFQDFLKEYLDVSGNIPFEQRRRGADNVISDLYRHALRVTLLQVTEDDGISLQEQERQLKWHVRDIYDRFFQVFCRDGAFPYEILLDPSMDMLYFERRNILRKGHLQQNYYNTIWMAEVFLQFFSGEHMARVRSEILLLCSDVSQFLPPPPEHSRMRFAAEMQAISWLDKSLAEYPENRVARERRQQLVSFLTAAEQINRFRHDVVSKIESIRGILGKLQERNPDGESRQQLQAAMVHVRTILGSFRLTMRERPSLRGVASMESFLERFADADVTAKLQGTPRPVVTDEEYLALVVQNLVQNAREAYARNRISGGQVHVVFDYDRLALEVRDWAGGIPEELRANDKLFEPYASSKGIQQNAGLGLANVREACRLLEASIRYEILKQDGHTGTVFIITLKEPERD